MTRRLSMLLLLLLLSGCSALLPKTKEATASPWQSFQDAQSAFDKIVPVQIDGLAVEGEQQVYGIVERVERIFADADLVEVVSAPDPRHVILQAEAMQPGPHNCPGEASSARLNALASLPSEPDLEPIDDLGHLPSRYMECSRMA